jgi:chromosome segregation ATPase
VAEADDRASQAEIRASDAQARADQADVKLAEAEALATQARTTADEVASRAADAEERLAAAESKAIAEAARVTEAEGRAVEARLQLAEIEAANEAIRHDLEEARRQRDAAEQEHTSAIVTLRAEHSREMAELASVQDVAVTAARAESAGARTELEQQLASVAELQRQLESDLEASTRHVAQLEGQIGDAKALAEVQESRAGQAEERILGLQLEIEELRRVDLTDEIRKVREQERHTAEQLQETQRRLADALKRLGDPAAAPPAQKATVDPTVETADERPDESAQQSSAVDDSRAEADSAEEPIAETAPTEEPAPQQPAHEGDPAGDKAEIDAGTGEPPAAARDGGDDAYEEEWYRFLKASAARADDD